ncbi:MAG: hypothetical protein ACJ73S_17075 [Mycobacteriales bacterium]|jgi:hypothetical protein
MTARWRNHRDSIRQDREMARAVFGATPAQHQELDMIAQLSRRPA